MTMTVMPRDTPMPRNFSFTAEEFNQLVDPMHVEIVSRLPWIHYLITEYDRLTYIAN